MFSSTLVKAILAAFILQGATVTAAALPLPDNLSVSPDGYHYPSQTFTEVTLPSGETIKVFDEPTSSPNPSMAVKRALSKRVDNCGDSTFVNKSSGASPAVDDCALIEQLARNTEKFWGVYSWSGPGWARMYEYRTCTIGFKTKNFGGAGIGNEDAADLIRDSIAKFQWNGLVGAEGDMGCWSGVETAKTLWAIFHT